MPSNECRCGCGETVNREFAPGHALRYAHALRTLARGGDLQARAEMYSRGWHWAPNATASGRAFGFEAEFFGMDQYTAVNALRTSGYTAEDDGYHHEARPYWRVTEDGSVSGEGCELVSPILNSRMKTDIDQARGALNVLAAEGGMVNRTCGLHVHHNLRGKTAIDVAETVGHWALFQDAINTILPSSRHNGEYCAGIWGAERWYSDVVQYSRGRRAVDINGMRFGRFHAINLNAIPAHGTLEYRQHSGTLNGDKLEHWVIFTRAMHDVSRIGSFKMLADMFGGEEAVAHYMDIDDVMRYLKVPTSTREFYNRRRESLRSSGDDEGADSGADDYYEDEEHEEFWCENCGEYHTEE